MASLKKLSAVNSGCYSVRSEHSLSNGFPVKEGTNEYRIVEKIASGGFGVAFKAVEVLERPFSAPKRFNTVPVCIKASGFKPKSREIGDKISSRASSRKDSFARDVPHIAEKDTLQKEARILSTLRNPHIVQLHEAFEVKGANMLWLVMEFVACNLEDMLYVDMFNDEINETLEVSTFESKVAQKAILHQVVRALVYLKSKRVIHKDLTPGNILVSKLGVVKLCDFGLADVMPVENNTVALNETDIKGKFEFLPPEMLVRRGDEETMSNYIEIDFGFDVWSFGVLLYAMHNSGNTFYTGFELYFKTSDWKAYSESDNAYYYSLIGSSAVDKSWLRKQSRQGSLSFDAKEHSKEHKRILPYLKELKQCLVPYADRGPGEPIDRDGLSTRIQIEALEKSKFFNCGSELHRKNCIMKVVNAYCQQVRT